MNAFREWLSDHLRYFLLLGGIILGIWLIVHGVTFVQRTVSGGTSTSAENDGAVRQGEVTVLPDGTESPSIVILSEIETGGETEEITAADTEEKTETKIETETETEVKPETETETETKPEAVTETELPPIREATKETGEPASGTSLAQTEKPEEETPRAEILSEPEKRTEGRAETLPETEKATERQAEAQRETEAEKETETAARTVISAETARPAQTAPETEAGTQLSAETERQTQKATETETPAQLQLPAETETATEKPAEAPETERHTEPPTEKQTERQTEEIETLKMYNDGPVMYASSSANVRSGPGTQYTVIGQTAKGDAFTVTGDTREWYQIRADGRTGYIKKTLLTEEYHPVYLTMTGTCYMRSEADYGDNIIGEYYAGTTVEFLEDVGGWYKVKVDGMTGYMGEKFFH